MLRRVGLAAFVLVAGACITLSIHAWVRRQDDLAARKAFDDIVERVFVDARARLELPKYGLGGARGMVGSLGHLPDPLSFARYVAARDMAAEFPGVVGFGLIVPVDRRDRARFEAQVRREGLPAFKVRTGGDRPVMHVIRSIEPAARNRAALGFDVGSEPLDRIAAERVFSDGLPSATGPIRLLQGPADRAGALILSPVFASGRATRQGADDRVIGSVFAAVVYDELMAGSMPVPRQWIDVGIRDLDAPAAGQVVFRSRMPGGNDAGRFKGERRFDYFGRHFVLEGTSTPAFDVLQHVDDRAAIIFVGLLASLLAAGLAYQQGRMRDRAERLAARMTRDLGELAAVARHTSSLVALLDADWRVHWANPAMLALCGLREDEVPGRPVRDLLRIPDEALLAKVAKRLAARQPFQGEVDIVSHAGERHTLALEVRPVDAVQTGECDFIIVGTDVTERNAKDAALRASGSLLVRMGQVAGVSGWEMDLATHKFAWTDQSLRIHGIDSSFDPLERNVLGLYQGQEQAKLREALRRAETTGEGWDLELRQHTPDGRDIWLRSVAEVERQDGRPVRLLGALLDITESVRQRQALEGERQRLAMTLDGTGAGTWEWNIRTGECRFNERWAEILGYSLAELAPINIATWQSLMHPDDLLQASAALERHFSGETPGYEHEFRMRHKLGDWVWVMARGRVFTHAADGKPEWMFGTHLDITRRKEFEIQLAASKELLFTTLHSIGDAVVTADAQGRITWLNPVAEAMVGWSSDEATGHMASAVLDLEIEGHPGTPPCPIDVCLQEGRKIGLAGDTVLVSRDGTRHVIEDSAAPLRDAQGTLCGVVMVFHDITEKAVLAREMNYRVSHDHLTGLLNRGEFESRTAAVLDRIGAGGPSGALMFLDLDHFKLVNDACGHAAGDRLLAQMAAILARAVRAHDAVARFGGDEFAILLDACPMEQAGEIATRILEDVEAYRYVGEDGRRFQVGVSIGLIRLDTRWRREADAVKAADAACYAAKAGGRGRVVRENIDAADAWLTESVLDGTVHWGALIGQALDEDQLVLHAQRIVPLHEGVAGGLHCEVLVRLADGKGGLIGPGAFMSSAERYQLASRVDRWVLRHVLRTLGNSGAAGIERIAVNCSGQSVGDRAFHDFAIGAIRDSGLPPEVLCIEITETAAVTNLANAARFIDALESLGVSVALDDFGSGASSFGYLKSLRVDKLKIDGQFVHGVLEGRLETAAIRSFIDVAGVLGIHTVAEQIESAAVAEKLRAMGVDYGQGFHFHRPEPFADVLAKWGRPRP